MSADNEFAELDMTEAAFGAAFDRGEAVELVAAPGIRIDNDAQVHVDDNTFGGS